MGVLIFVGFLLLIYAGLIIVYLQQDTKQAELEGQISRTAAIVAKPMSDTSELEGEYQDIQEKLRPPTRDEAIAWLVVIAAKHGIDIDPAAGKLVIPPASVKVGSGEVAGKSYQVMSFGGIRIQSSHSNVMSLVSDLDAGATRETIVLTSLDIQSLAGGGADGAAAEALTRAAERDRVQVAVASMMAANNLTAIANPLNYAGGVASDDMAAFPDPASEWLGTPGGKTFDVSGGAYRAGDAPGYVLYNHDDEADGSTGGSTDYIGVSQTTYFYTCEADGTVRQFLTADRSGEVMAAQSEVNAILSVDIYSLKPEEAE